MSSWFLTADSGNSTSLVNLDRCICLCMSEDEESRITPRIHLLRLQRDNHALWRLPLTQRLQSRFCIQSRKLKTESKLWRGLFGNFVTMYMKKKVRLQKHHCRIASLWSWNQNGHSKHCFELVPFTPILLHATGTPLGNLCLTHLHIYCVLWGADEMQSLEWRHV